MDHEFRYSEIIGAIKDLKKDVRDDLKEIRSEQVSQGKKLAKVCDRVSIHSKIHGATGTSILALCLFWIKSKFTQT